MFQLSITLRLNEFARTFNLAPSLKQLKGMVPCRSICGHLEQFFLIYKVNVVQDLIYFHNISPFTPVFLRLEVLNVLIFLDRTVFLMRELNERLYAECFLA